MGQAKMQNLLQRFADGGAQLHPVPAQQMLMEMEVSSNASRVSRASVPVLKDRLMGLQDGIAKARQRITIGSLYIGTDAGLQTSTAAMLDEVLLQGGSKRHTPSVALFHTPALRGLLKRVLPPRVNEVVGVNHLKVYLFDEDVILSGANLSNTYFTHRQDRYIHLRGVPSLAAQLQALVEVVSHFSYPLQPGGQLGPCPSGIDPLRQPALLKRQLKAGLETLFKPGMAPSAVLMPHWDRQAYAFASGIAGLPKGVHLGMLGLLRSPPDALQLGFAGVRQDEECTAQLLSSAEAGSKLQLSTAYLNLAHRFEQELGTLSNVDIDMLTASPWANGFFGSKGQQQRYGRSTAWAKDMLRHVVGVRIGNLEAGGSAQRQLLEYGRPGWEYHAKGIWYTPPGADSPCVTAIGSSNYGYRSVFKDLEAHFFIFTRHPGLSQGLGLEYSRLKQHATQVQDQMFQSEQRRASQAARMAVRMARGFL
eukprot:jgi/Astpho2/5904/Aster-x0268